MADLAVTRSVSHNEPKAVLEAERLDEGRWESEGGITLPQKSMPHLPHSHSPAPQAEEFDPTKVHPRSVRPTLVGKPADSKYPVESVTNEQAAHGDKPNVERRKSFSEKLASGWSDFKHKAEELIHSKDKKSDSNHQSRKSSSESAAPNASSTATRKSSSETKWWTTAW